MEVDANCVGEHSEQPEGLNGSSAPHSTTGDTPTPERRHMPGINPSIYRRKKPMVPEAGGARPINGCAAAAGAAGESIGDGGPCVMDAEGAVGGSEHDETLFHGVVNSESSAHSSIYTDDSRPIGADDGSTPKIRQYGPNNKIIINVRGTRMTVIPLTNLDGSPQPFPSMPVDRCTQTSRPPSKVVNERTATVMVPAAEEPNTLNGINKTLATDGLASSGDDQCRELVWDTLDTHTKVRLIRLIEEQLKVSHPGGFTPPRATSSPLLDQTSPRCSHCKHGSHPKPPPDHRTLEWVVSQAPNFPIHGGARPRIPSRSMAPVPERLSPSEQGAYTPLVAEGLHRQESHEEKYVPMKPMNGTPMPFHPAPHAPPHWHKDPPTPKKPPHMERKSSCTYLPIVIPEHIREQARREDGYIDKLSISEKRRNAAYQMALKTYSRNDMMYFIWRKDEFYNVISFVYNQEIHDLYVFYAEDGFLHLENSHVKTHTFSELINACKQSPLPVHPPSRPPSENRSTPEEQIRRNSGTYYKSGLKRAIKFGQGPQTPSNLPRSSQAPRLSETAKRPPPDNHSPPVPARRHRDSDTLSRSSNHSRESNYEVVKDRQTPNG